MEKKEKLLLPLNDYVKAGVHLGTGVITAAMRRYVYKRRADGLAIINTKEIDNKLRAAAGLLAQFPPDKILIACKREAGWLALEQVGSLSSFKIFTKKYPPGIITNPKLPEFFEPSIAVIADSWIDKNPMKDALKLNIPIISLCDTNNLTSYIDLVVPCNNKSPKSLGLIFWVLAKEYGKLRGLKLKMPPLSSFTGEGEEESGAESPEKEK